jgi:predicted NodU family carbamoyl transferase
MSVNDASHAEYIETFAWQLAQRICASLECANKQMAFEPHFVTDESLRHINHAQSRASACIASPASQRMAMTLDAYLESSGRGCSALCLHGASGCGKSMLIAENVSRLSLGMFGVYQPHP